jgi:hypothetical protein
MPISVSVSLTGAADCLYIYGLLHIRGGRSSAGRALDCGSSGRGFKSRRSPSKNQGVTPNSLSHSSPTVLDLC